MQFYFIQWQYRNILALIICVIVYVNNTIHFVLYSIITYLFNFHSYTYTGSPTYRYKSSLRYVTNNGTLLMQKVIQTNRTENGYAPVTKGIKQTKLKMTLLYSGWTDVCLDHTRYAVNIFVCYAAYN